MAITSVSVWAPPSPVFPRSLQESAAFPTSLKTGKPGSWWRPATSTASLNTSSPSSPANIEIVARGLNPDQGGAEIVHYQTASGGAVYSAGSITYPASLLVDAVVSKITANVIKRFTTV